MNAWAVLKMARAILDQTCLFDGPGKQWEVIFTASKRG